MDSADLEVYEVWDLSLPTVRPHSRLFHLEPIGLGTPWTECLTSYTTRLAEAHGVTVRKLVIEEVLPHLGRERLATDRTGNLLSAFWRNESRALNGTGSLADNLVRVLEALTGCRHLRYLTLLTWAEVLPVSRLQRLTRAWCPACYEEWRRDGRAVYDPLIWSLTPVSACPRHRRRLRVLCPYDDCRRASTWLNARSRPGYCVGCRRWLGRLEEAAEDESLTAEELEAQAWIVEAVGELVEAAPILDQIPKQQQLIQALRSLANRLTGGNKSGLARGLGLREQTVAGWIWGKTRPTLWMLLELCHRLDTTPLRLFVRGTGGGTEESVAGALGASGWTMERARMIRDLPHRPRFTRTFIDPDVTRGILEAILASDELPPPSLRGVCRRLGLTQTNLKKHLPKLCQAISERFRRYQLDQGERTRETVRAKVREAALQLHAQGVYPSSSRIWLLLGRPGWIRSRCVLEEWHKTLRELGWQT